MAFDSKETLPAPPTAYVVVRGAREHNLKGIDVSFPRDTLTTFTGVSGSGKSSLAFHTIYQEGQRRFLESLSSYARQFLGSLEKPRVDSIEGLSPTVSIDQKSRSHSARSTVGTLTEVLDFLRLLWARLGTPRCPECGETIENWSTDRIVETLLAEHDSAAAVVLAPVVKERKGEYRRELAEWRQSGFVRARIDGEIRRLDEEVVLERYVYHTIELVVDRLTIGADAASRLREAVEQAVSLGGGSCTVRLDGAGDRVFSTLRNCPRGHAALPEMEPRLFSFNSPVGACPHCDGLGEIPGFAEDLLVEDADKSLREGAIPLFNRDGKIAYGTLTLDHLAQVGEAFGFDLDTSWNRLSKKARRVILHGSGSRTFEFRWMRNGASFQTTGRDRIPFPGLLHYLERVYRPSRARHLDRFRTATTCPECGGTRLCRTARAVTLDGRTLPEVLSLDVERALSWIDGLRLEGNAARIGREVLLEIRRRLRFLMDVGLGYLTLDRRARTLSGGESQRIRLAAQVGAGLRGILYVLDEPSIGLHARDQDRLLSTLEALRDRGNTVAVVEHDRETIERSDFVVDIGPGAGDQGGTLVAAGPVETVAGCRSSVTGRYLRGELAIPVPAARRTGRSGLLKLLGARCHNLRGVGVGIPLGRLVAVTGVSGSGKSTLVHHVLLPNLRRVLLGRGVLRDRCDGIEGADLIDKVIEIDQAPIGRTPRSNAATYTEVWTLIRDLFAALPESRLREYRKGRFSFNVSGGRCEACEGAGIRLVDLNFLAPVEVVCEECGGARFSPETLEIRFKGHSVHDVLEMTVDRAAEVFADLPKIAAVLRTMQEVGLGYIRLGQPSTTLSGGEAQRVKLASELRRPGTGKTLYVLDEPTTGLHFADVERLLHCLQRLCDAGNTVLVIEHNLDVVKCADWIIDLGPEGGDCGGRVVAEGTPEDVARSEESLTGLALRPVLGLWKRRRREARALAERRPSPTAISVRGASTNNLAGIDVDLPLNRFCVVTGVSGSGKSSFAFDTLFQEGQRRFLESLSTYARRFLGRLDRAPVDSIDGLGPAIAIDQRHGSRSLRSTVATSTEIHDYLRLLYARVGRPHCPEHGTWLRSWTPARMASDLIRRWGGRSGYVLAPVVPPKGLERRASAAARWFDALRVEWREAGFVRALCGGVEMRLDEPWPDELPDEVDLVVDRVTFENKNRLIDAIEQALRAAASHGAPPMVQARLRQGKRLVYAFRPICPECGHAALEHPEPRSFSFNHHSGACATCSGLGEVVVCDPDLLVNRPDRPLFGGAIRHRGAAFTFLTRPEGWYAAVARSLAERKGIDLERPWEELPREHRDLLMRGAGDERFPIRFEKKDAGRARTWDMEVPFKGLARQVEEWFRGKDGDRPGDDRLRSVMRARICPDCEGERLQRTQRHYRIGGLRLPQILSMTVAEARKALARIRWTAAERQVARDLLAEIENRLRFLDEVGLGYLTLDRSAATLSGGEAQRIRLASQLGNRLMGVLYVLDEPTVGLHPRDTERLLASLLGLRDLGNTVVAVEHDEAMIRAADFVMDLGPGAGARGGRLVASGTPEQIARGNSLTGRYLRGDLSVRRLATPGRVAGRIELRGITVHNLRGLDVDIPLGVMTAVTGVSGSGKSSLVIDGLIPELRRGRARLRWTGTPRAHRLVVVDQSPVGTSPSSNPATYTQAFGPIRRLFAATSDARRKGFSAARFSHHVSQGRCAACDGRGRIRIEMHFLADVWVECETCRGRRYNAETLSVRYRGLDISQVLELDVETALDFFGNHPKIVRPLRMLRDVGLGYLRLGQAADTLSGGEAQRMKLAAELAVTPRDHGIYILDEPTTGLHLDDVDKLLGVLERLVGRGDTVIVIEHHLDVIAAADHVIEMGPEAGDAGGRVVASGTPAEVAARGTHTGRFLRAKLGAERPPARRRREAAGEPS
ncbi:MAG: excinuclease ABC subunit UvrA [Planctomycetota bacterium]